MIEAVVAFSRSQYRPGETIDATICVQNLDRSNPGSNESTFDRASTSIPRRRRSKELEFDRLHDEDILTTSALNSPQNTSPSLITTTTHTQNHNSRKTHAKSKSVSFSPVNSPARKRCSSASFTSSTDREYIMILHAQLMGTFTLDQSLVDAARFNDLKGQGIHDSSGGGLISTNSLVASRWSLASWSGVLGVSHPSSLDNLRQAVSKDKFPIISVAPTILDIELILSPGDKKEMHYSFTLPQILPPSYDGESFKMFYELKISSQRQERGTTVFACPIRILANSATYDFNQPLLLSDADSAPPQQRPAAHPVLSSEGHDNCQESYLKHLKSICDSQSIENGRPECWQGSTTDSTRSGPSESIQFQISRNDAETACVLVLPSRNFLIGGVIHGSLDFSVARLQCLKVKISLESSEILDTGYASKRHERNAHATRHKLCQTTVSCAFSWQSMFEIIIPATLTETFSTVPLKVEYSLHFEFTLYDQARVTNESRTKHGIEVEPVAVLLVEPFECRIPCTLSASHSFSRLKMNRGTL